MDCTEPHGQYDLLIVGGGIGGVIGLHYAKKAGLEVLLFEKQSVVGGLWAQLPAWQDIQINQNDWTLGNLPITGTTQASIAKNVQAWVDKFDLAPLIRLNSRVEKAQATPQGWTVSTPDHVYSCRFLLAATGVHNRAFIPNIERLRSNVRRCILRRCMTLAHSLAGMWSLLAAARPPSTCSSCVCSTRPEKSFGCTVL